MATLMRVMQDAGWRVGRRVSGVIEAEIAPGLPTESVAHFHRQLTAAHASNFPVYSALIHGWYPLKKLTAQKVEASASEVRRGER
jgi:hypothetical protein